MVASTRRKSGLNEENKKIFPMGEPAVSADLSAAQQAPADSTKTVHQQNIAISLADNIMRRISGASISLLQMLRLHSGAQQQQQTTPVVNFTRSDSDSHPPPAHPPLPQLPGAGAATASSTADPQSRAPRRKLLMADFVPEKFSLASTDRRLLHFVYGSRLGSRIVSYRKKYYAIYLPIFVGAFLGSSLWIVVPIMEEGSSARQIMAYLCFVCTIIYLNEVLYDANLELVKKIMKTYDAWFTILQSIFFCVSFCSLLCWEDNSVIITLSIFLAQLSQILYDSFLAPVKRLAGYMTIWTSSLWILLNIMLHLDFVSSSCLFDRFDSHGIFHSPEGCYRDRPTVGSKSFSLKEFTITRGMTFTFLLVRLAFISFKDLSCSYILSHRIMEKRVVDGSFVAGISGSDEVNSNRIAGEEKQLSHGSPRNRQPHHEQLKQKNADGELEIMGTRPQPQNGSGDPLVPVRRTEEAEQSSRTADAPMEESNKRTPTLPATTHPASASSTTKPILLNYSPSFLPGATSIYYLLRPSISMGAGSSASDAENRKKKATTIMARSGGGAQRQQQQQQQQQEEDRGGWRRWTLRKKKAPHGTGSLSFSTDPQLQKLPRGRVKWQIRLSTKFRNVILQEDNHRRSLLQYILNFFGVRDLSGYFHLRKKYRTLFWLLATVTAIANVSIVVSYSLGQIPARFTPLVTTCSFVFAVITWLDILSYANYSLFMMILRQYQTWHLTVEILFFTISVAGLLCWTLTGISIALLIFMGLVAAVMRDTFPQQLRRYTSVGVLLGFFGVFTVLSRILSNGLPGECNADRFDLYRGQYHPAADINLFCITGDDQQMASTAGQPGDETMRRRYVKSWSVAEFAVNRLLTITLYLIRIVYINLSNPTAFTMLKNPLEIRAFPVPVDTAPSSRRAEKVVPVGKGGKASQQMRKSPS